MLRRDRLLLWAGIVLAAGLAATSGWAAYREFTPFIRSSSAIAAKVQALARTVVEPGLSYRSKELVLNDCNAALSSIEAATIDQDRRAALFGNCGSIASAILEESPTFSLAYLVLARVGAEAGSDAQLSGALVGSQQSAPFQEWLALSRVMIGFGALDRLSEAAQAAVANDVGVALYSQRGANWIAQRYVREPDRREIIRAMVEGAEPAQQRRFLSAVQRIQEAAS